MQLINIIHFERGENMIKYKSNKPSPLFNKLIIFLIICICISPLKVYGKTDTKEEYKNFIENLFVIRNKSILTQDLDAIESLYDTSTQCGQWAFEYEEAKVKYINNWAQKQGVKFTDIIPHIHIQSSKIHDTTSSFYILCSTDYKYIYDNEPDVINTSRIGTYHCLTLNNKNDALVITKEWYTDPFADSLKLENIKADEIKDYILSQPYRDLSSIDERRQGAIDYATKYCGAATPEEFEHKYNKSYRDFNPEGGDCANFASQILHEGGKFRTNATWNYAKGSATGPWINADKFTHYMLNSGRASVIAHGTYDKVYKASYKLLPGDFVAYEKKGDITHISTVTGADSKGYSLVTCHNTDRYNVPWDLGWSDKNMKFWLVRVHY